MPEVYTVARKVPIFGDIHNGKLTPFAPARELEPNTKVEVVADTAMYASGLPYLWCFVQSGAYDATSGYIPRHGVFSGYVSKIVGREGQQFTGVKYGAYKAGAGASRAQDREDVDTIALARTGGGGSQYLTPSAAHALPGNPKIEYKELLMANSATCPRCGGDRGDHKLLETVAAKNIALAIHNNFRTLAAPVGGAFMMGVLMGGVRGKRGNVTEKTWFAMSDAAPGSAVTAANTYCTANAIRFVKSTDLDGNLVDFYGDTIDRVDPGALGCAGPKLVQFALQNPPFPKTLFLSEIWYKAGAPHELYADASTIDSCDRCRVAIPPMLCGHNNPYKKSVVGRPKGWVGVGQMV